MSQSRVLDLQIRPGRWFDGVEPLPSTSTRYKIVEASVHMGLSILETPEGRQSLARVARAIIEEGRSEQPPRRDIYKGSLKDMPAWINRFLTSMRFNFPAIFIHDEVGGEAEAQRLDWGDNMQDYDAGLGGRISLSSALIDNMVYAHQQLPQMAGDSYIRFKFQMGLSIAHEIVHLLTGFITGDPNPLTPPEVSLLRYGDSEAGEAGRYWEHILFGGVVEFWSFNDDPMNVRQTGTAYFFENGDRDATGYAVSLGYMNEFANQVFTFPIRRSSEAVFTTRAALTRANCSETTKLRTRRRQNRAPPANSPAPDHWSANMRYRMPPSGSQGHSRVPGQSTNSQAGGSDRGYASQPGRPSQAYNPPAGGSGRGYASQSSRPSQAYPPAAGGSGRAYSSQTGEPSRPSNPQSTRSDRSYPNPFAPRSSAPSQPSYTQPTRGSRPPEYYYRR
ncbi:hypothetical protein FSOLCH5_004596 [Fusarium solani]